MPRQVDAKSVVFVNVRIRRHLIKSGECGINDTVIRWIESHG